MTARRRTTMTVRHVVAVAVFGLAALSGCGTGEPDLVATITGIVEQGPTCPVETLDSPCPPAPAVGARVEVRAESAEGLPSQDVETFTLDAGDDVEAQFLLDTGIR